MNSINSHILLVLCGSVSIALGVLGVISSGKKLTRILWGVCSFCWAVTIGWLFFSSGLYIVSSDAVSIALTACVLCLWQSLALCEEGALRLSRYNSVFLVILGCFSLIPHEPRSVSFFMDYIYAKIFFLSRPLTLGLAICALGACLVGHKAAVSSECNLPKKMANRARRAAFLASLVFLSGEIAGCYWGFLGWGTTWRWSGRFFFSAMIFVFLMATIHLPRSFDVRSKTGTWRLTIPLAIVVFSMLMERVLP